VHIDGVQGSGKSYICSKLKNILSVDTDNIMEQVKKEVSLIQKKNFPTIVDKKTLKLVIIMEKKIVKEYIDNNKIIIFAGMTVDIPNPTHKFFIKIDDPNTVYKRLLLRELEKIITNNKNIQNYINITNPSEININNISKQSIPFPVSYNDFLDDYKERLKEAKKHNYKVLTQEKIIETITKMI